MSSSLLIDNKKIPKAYPMYGDGEFASATEALQDQHRGQYGLIDTPSTTKEQYQHEDDPLLLEKQKSTSSANNNNNQPNIFIHILTTITLFIGATMILIYITNCGYNMIQSARTAMKIPLADKITCTNSKLQSHKYPTGKPIALIHTSSCQPCSYFQPSVPQATGYEGAACYHSPYTCCSRWSSTSYHSKDDDTAQTCLYSLYERQVKICPPENFKVEWTVSFTYPSWQEEEGGGGVRVQDDQQGDNSPQTMTVAQCHHSRIFTQSEYASHCTVLNQHMHFEEHYQEGDYSCYLRIEGRYEKDICKSLSRGQPIHYGQDFKFLVGILVVGIGALFILISFTSCVDSIWQHWKDYPKDNDYKQDQGEHSEFIFQAEVLEST